MKRLLFISLFMGLICFLGCAQEYSENLFFSNDVLEKELLPELPIPNSKKILFCEKYGANENRVYVTLDNQTSEEYFLEVMKYIEKLTFKHLGTVKKIKDEFPVLGTSPTYYYHSNDCLTSISASNYYFEEENSYILVYSNGEIKLGNDSKEEYIDKAHMIKVVNKSGTYQNGDYTFDYDYYIEFISEPSVWLEKEDNRLEPTGTFKLTIKDNDNYIYDKFSEENKLVVPGTEIVLHAYPIMDADLALYINGEYYCTQSYIKINDEYIWEYRFEMPPKDTIIEFKVETTEYLDIKTVLNIPLISQDEVIKVRYEQGYIGVAPGSLTNISYSEDIDDINNILSLLEMSLYEEKGDDWRVTGGSYKKYTIFTNDNTYVIDITNGYISYNKKHYKFIGEYITLKNPNITAKSFITYLDTYEAYFNDGTKIGDFDKLSDIEFIEYPYDVIPENEDIGYLETEFGRLHIHSEKIFYKVEDNVHIYYLIVSESDFYDVFGFTSK